MREPNTVAVNEPAPTVLVRSTDALVPRSAWRGRTMLSRVRPAASVSSVSGVDAKNPRPTETRLVQPGARNSAASLRTEKNVPLFVVEIDSATGRHDQPGGEVDIILCEHAGHIVGVAKPPHVDRIVVVAFVSEPGDPGVPPAGAWCRNLAEERVVMVTFEDVTKLMTVGIPTRPRHAPSRQSDPQGASERFRRRRSGAFPAPQCTVDRSQPALRLASSHRRGPRK